MSLTKAAIIGVRWTTISNVVSSVIQFAQIVVLARILPPSDFGLMAMVLVVLSVAQTYTDVGISNALIQQRDTTHDQLSSLYWLNIFVGFFLFAAAVGSTPFVVVLYREPRLYLLLPISAVVLLIGALGTQFQTLLQKTLQFRSIALIDITKTLIAATVAICAALSGLGVYSLVFGSIVGSFISSLLLMSIGWRQWRPILRFQLIDLRGYFRFGLFQVGERTVFLIYSKLDQVLIGALFGAEILGYYSLAWNLVFLPWKRINRTFTHVAFPIFSRVEDSERLKRGYMTMVRIVSVIGAPVALGCAATAPLMVPLVYGPQWAPAIPLVQVLSGVGLLNAISTPIAVLLLSRGRADLEFWWTLTVAALQVPAIYLGLRFGGPIGLVWVMLAMQFFCLTAEYPILIRRLLGPCLWSYLNSTVPPIVIAAVMATIVWWIPGSISAGSVLTFGIQVIAGVVAYLVLSIMFQRTWLVRSLKAFNAGVQGEPSSSGTNYNP